MDSGSGSLIVGASIGIALVILGHFLFKRMGHGGSVANTKSSSSTAAVAAEKPASKKEELAKKYPAGKLSIYFGSQTGTAEGLARTLMEEAKAVGFEAKIVDLEEFSAEHLAELPLAVFLMATYGEGEPTDNAARFVKWLRNEDAATPASYLQSLRFCVFGLGNRQYEHYNRMGKLVNAQLAQLGGQRAHEYGEGDDDGSLEDDFEAWKARLLPALVRQFHPDAAASASQQQLAEAAAAHEPLKLDFDAVFVPRGSVRQASSAGSNASSASSNASSGSGNRPRSGSAHINGSTKHFFTAPRATVLANRELRTHTHTHITPVDSVAAGSTRHIELDLTVCGLKYVTADNLAVLPENDPQLVAALAQQQGLQLDDEFELRASDGAEDDFKLPIPSPCTVQQLLSLYLDLQGPARHASMRHLLPFVADASQRQWLDQLTAKDTASRAQFKQLVDGGKRSLADLLLKELSSCKLPLNQLMHAASFIQPRLYTISSSSSLHPQQVHLTVSITQHALKHGGVFTGLTSGYLQRLNPGDSVRVFVRASSFRLPVDRSLPIVMVGPGTGIAPMRALLQERDLQRTQAAGSGSSTPVAVASSDSCGDNVLYFGCKHESGDFLYREELQQLQQRGSLTHLRTAFSRDGPEKVYVQHLLQQPAHAQELAELLLRKGAYMYVCGATAMGHDVMAAVVAVLRAHGGMGAEEAQACVKQLQDHGRYVQELWTA